MPRTLDARQLAHFGWFLLIWGLPWSHAAMSVGTGIVGLAWVWQTARGPRQTSGFSRPWVLWAAAWAGFEVLSMAWSDHLAPGWHMLRVQAPLVLILAAARTAPPPSRRTLWVLGSASVALAGVLAFGAWRIGHGEALAPRDWTPWTSHIRLSLLAALGVGWGLSDPFPSRMRTWLVATCLGLWAVFLAVAGSLTTAVLLPAALAWGAWVRWKDRLPSRAWIWGTAGALALGAWAGFAVLRPVDLPAKPWAESTPWGNAYEHRPDTWLSEGGHRVHMHVCESEWEVGWRAVSDVPLDGPQGSLRPVLLRYVTSLGLPKDGATLAALPREHVRAIEARRTNVHEARGMAQRLRELRFELEMWHDGGNPSGHSLVQRLEHWRAGWHAFAAAPWVGHGMGDFGVAMAKAYEEAGSKLAPNVRHGTHNQFLNVLVRTGLAGGLAWVGFLAAGAAGTRRLGSRSSRMAAAWGWGVLVASCLVEDTVETQAGVLIALLALLPLEGPNDA